MNCTILTDKEMVAIKIYGDNIPYTKPLHQGFIDCLGCSEERAKELLGIHKTYVKLMAHVHNKEEVDSLVEEYININGDEPLGVGHWMIDWGLEEQVKHRIACPEKGYPVSEAFYPDIASWEKDTGKNWGEYLADMV